MPDKTAKKDFCEEKTQILVHISVCVCRALWLVCPKAEKNRHVGLDRAPEKGKKKALPKKELLQKTKQGKSLKNRLWDPKIIMHRAQHGLGFCAELCLWFLCSGGPRWANQRFEGRLVGR